MLPTKVSVHLAKRFQRRIFFRNQPIREKHCLWRPCLSTDQNYVIMFANDLGSNEQSLQRTFHRCFLPSFCSFGQSVSQEKVFQKSTNQKQELPVVAIFVNPKIYHTPVEPANYHTPGEPANYHTPGEPANYYSTDVVHCVKYISY